MSEILKHIEQLKAVGYRVFAPVSLTTYFYIVQGQHVAYCQHDRLQGVIYSSVHKACQHAGTGYHADSLPDALGYRPNWATGDAMVVKYKSIDEFCAKHWQQLIEQ